ncbi:hypothetical protein N7445_004228, partial [Penicillium cf. griseofulvum]
CLIDYKVKYDSSRQFFLSAIDISRTSLTIGLLERLTKVILEEIESRVKDTPNKDELTTINLISSNDITSTDYTPSNIRGSDPNNCLILIKNFRESDITLAIGNTIRNLRPRLTPKKSEKPNVAVEDCKPNEPDILESPNRTSLITYLIRLYNKNDIYDIKLRVTRYSLFLFFIREIEYKLETTLKRNIVSTLYNSRGLIPVEKRKLYKSFYNKKKIGTPRYKALSRP